MIQSGASKCPSLNWYVFAETRQDPLELASLHVPVLRLRLQDQGQPDQAHEVQSPPQEMRRDRSRPGPNQRGGLGVSKSRGQQRSVKGEFETFAYRSRYTYRTFDFELEFSVSIPKFEPNNLKILAWITNLTQKLMIFCDIFQKYEIFNNWALILEYLNSFLGLSFFLELFRVF